MHKQDEMKKLLLLFLLLAGIKNSTAQYIISGKVVFAEDQKPVSLASVFLSNTSVGSVTSNDGTFQLEVGSPGKYDLIVSFVGFETIQKTINIPSAEASNMLLMIKPKPRELQEVVIGEFEEQSWKRWGRFFTDNFLGTGSWASACTMKNEDKIHFLYSKRQQILKAYCDEQLIISNKKTGYRITYKLESFEYNFTTKVLFYQGYPLFEEMSSRRDAQHERWLKARNKIYYGSMMHFMRSLYRNKLVEDGFEIRHMVRTYNTEKKRVQQLYRNRLRNKGENNLPVPADSSAYYATVLEQKDYSDSFSSYTLTGDSIAYALDSVTAVLHFNNFLHITYKNGWEDADYVGYYSGSTKTNHPSSYMLLMNDPALLVFANGFYFDTKNVLTYGYWSWSEKMGRMLPFDFKPTSP